VAPGTLTLILPKKRGVDMNALERFENLLARIEYCITVPIFLIMLTVMILQVFFRYVLAMPLSWSEEMARYLFVACTFFGAAIATKEREHVEINITEVVIESWIKDRAKKIITAKVLNVIRDVVAIIFLLIATNETYKLMTDQLNMGQVSTAMEFPIWIVTCSMLIGFLLCMVHCVLLIILNLGNRGATGYEFLEEVKEECN